MSNVPAGVWMIDVATLLSWFACLVTFTLVAKIPQLRSLGSGSLLANLQISTCVASWISACANLITTIGLDDPFDSDGNLTDETNTWCLVSAWLGSFGVTAMIFWIFVMSVFFVYEISRPELDHEWDRKFFKVSHIIVWSWALLWTIIPSKWYGGNGFPDFYVCWTRPGTPDWVDWFQFAGPLAVTFLVSIIICIKIIFLLRQFRGAATVRVYGKVLFQYGVLMFIFAPIFISNLRFNIHPYQPSDFETVFTFVCWKLEGFLISCLIMSNAQIQQIIFNYFSNGNDDHQSQSAGGMSLQESGMLAEDSDPQRDDSYYILE